MCFVCYVLPAKRKVQGVQLWYKTKLRFYGNSLRAEDGGRVCGRSCNPVFSLRFSFHIFRKDHLNPSRYF